MFKAQANSSSTIIAFFNILGFISFAIVQPVRCAYKTAVCTYNQPDETTGKMDLELGISWSDVWNKIASQNLNFQASGWRLAGLIKLDETDEDKMMRARIDSTIDGKWSGDAMRAVWQKGKHVMRSNIELIGQLEITCGLGRKFEPAGGLHLVEQVIREMAGCLRVRVMAPVLTAGKINIDYTITFEHDSESEADRIADRVRRLEHMTVFSFKKSANEKWFDESLIDAITYVKSKISPTMMRDVATINLHLGGKTVPEGEAYFLPRVSIQRNWAETRFAIVKHLGNSISPESHIIRYSTVSHGGPEHDGKTNLSDKDIIYVSVTQKVATINLQLDGQTVTDGTARFAAKVNVQGSWTATKAAIIKQLGNSISQATHNILYSTVSQKGAEHDDRTNLSDKDIIYVSATTRVFSGSGNSTDGAKEKTNQPRYTTNKITIVKCWIGFLISVGVGIIVVAIIALWRWYRRHQKQKQEKEMELSRGQATW